jgi:hypothetical protein
VTGLPALTPGPWAKTALSPGLTAVLAVLPLAPGERPFDLVVAVRVGALDGRHPQAGAHAWPRLRATLARGGRIFVDGVETAGPACG